MNIKNKTATIVASVIIGVTAITGTAYAIAVTTPDKPEEASTTITTTVILASLSETGTIAAEPETTAAATSAPAPTQQQTTVAPVTTTETSKEITFEYDATLSKQIADLIVEKYPDMKYRPAGKLTAYPDNLVKEGKVGTANTHFIFSDICDSNNPAQSIIEQWLRAKPDYIYQGNYNFDIEAYRFSNGYFYIEFH